MLIRYNIGYDIVTCCIDYATAAEHIEKLRSIGAKHITVYKVACSCNAGLRQIDEDGTEEPCTNCMLGRQYDGLFNPDKVIPF